MLVIMMSTIHVVADKWVFSMIKIDIIRKILHNSYKLHLCFTIYHQFNV